MEDYDIFGGREKKKKSNELTLVAGDLFKILTDGESLRSTLIMILSDDFHYGHNFTVLSQILGVNFAIKISVIDIGSEDLVTIEKSIITEINTEIVKKNISPCFIKKIVSYELPLSNYNVKGCERFDTVFASNAKDMFTDTICTYKGDLSAGSIKDELNFMIMETCDVSFRKLLVSVAKVDIPFIKASLFMIYHALYCADKLLGFVHGDLHPGNIMFVNFGIGDYMDPCEPRAIRYIIDGEKVDVPWYGMMPKIIDFGFSSTEKIQYNNKNDDQDILYDFLRLMHFIAIETTSTAIYNVIIKELSYIDETLSFVKYKKDKVKSFVQNTNKHKLLLKLSAWFKSNVEFKILHTYDPL